MNHIHTPHLRWSVALANPIVGGGDCIAPALDPSDPAHLYIADGWGSSYASMKLRRLSLAAGETLVTASVKNSVRALHFHPDRRHIHVAGDKKILVLDAVTLDVIDKHGKKLLHYPAHLSSIDEHTLLTADLHQGWLFTYDLATRTGKRRRIAKSCRLLEPVSGDSTSDMPPRCHYYADGQSGALLHYDPATGRHGKLWEIPPYGSCRISDDRTLFVAQLATYAPSPNVPKLIQAAPTARVQIHRLGDGALLHALDAPHSFTRLALSAGNKHLALWNRRQLSLHDIVTRKQLLKYNAPEQQTLLAAHPAHRLFFTTDTTGNPSLHCHEY